MLEHARHDVENGFPAAVNGSTQEKRQPHLDYDDSDSEPPSPETQETQSLSPQIKPAAATNGISPKNSVLPTVFGKSMPENDMSPQEPRKFPPNGKDESSCCSKLASIGRGLARFVKVLLIGFMACSFILGTIHWPVSLREDPEARALMMSILFCNGLIMVALEDVLLINKSAMMLCLAATMWVLLAMAADTAPEQNELHKELSHGLLDVGSVVLFLLPAMAVVETMDHFDGFALVMVLIRKMSSGKQSRVPFILALYTFFLSSIIDNLTATIVTLKILKLIGGQQKFRHLCGGLVVIAANAGGAWSPVGDVTTTMLWIQHKITSVATIKALFIPSLVAGLTPIAGVWWHLQSNGLFKTEKKSKKQHYSTDSDMGDASDREMVQDDNEFQPLRHYNLDLAETTEQEPRVTKDKCLAFSIGIMCIMMVPVLKTLTGLPPYIGMLLALGTMWLVADACLPNKNQHAGNGHGGGVIDALHKVDLSGLLFFTGVLLSVGSLNSAGVLHRYADWMVAVFGHDATMLCTVLGISSALVDNVPLVEAAIDMFEETPCDDPLWQLTALAAGTGGSILSIGSVAGVTFMSMEGVGFLWYFRRIGLWAAVGYGLGIVTYTLQRSILGV
eukprot:gnl/MRDRNA2_/MRDRNA2_139893_c0_seq1.p1 gnl/MRDRNA2_/MRDRNA2_139893_c0~~gnl/MRDRNA2_/MRDRNA2_139893_c0_seq1.p1  ORF type:complete len:618 (+),score=115.00 gnl/MRDRNA2_/MRDRNA2_139893_c0_seq1:63-1916(+)